MKKIMMVAFHYPPFRGGSGIHRTLKFSRYLPDYGWQPMILTANPRAYPQVGNDQLHDIPECVHVTRASAWDTARHFSVRGAYFKWLALPDRWISWWIGAVPAGLRLIWKYRPEIIWSTYPIATAHLIALTLHKMTGIPWIADFRDSMTEEGYPPDPEIRRAYRAIERLTIHRCTKGVFTTPGTVKMYADRYPEVPLSRFSIIANGYDEEDFISVEPAVASRPRPEGPVVLLHSGLLYPSERDPRAFFAALADLRQSGKISSANLRVVLRGSGHEEFYRRQLHESGIEEIVFLKPAIPYNDALAEMLNADGLLIFQAANCNHQIPAKVYEYLRAKRPIFALTDPTGDTANLIKTMGIDTIVPLDSKEQIAEGILKFIRQIREGRASVARDNKIERYSRKALTQELANLFGSI